MVVRVLLVLVTGSRTWTDPQPIRELLAALPRLTEDGVGGITILHGGARGADTLAGEIAAGLGYTVETVTVGPAEWRRHGRRAGLLRNLVMLDRRPDLVLAFLRDGSPGTSHTIAEA